jgi:hypothetical protein
MKKPHEADERFIEEGGVRRTRRSGRKLATRKERMQLERLRSLQIRDTIVTDEEFEVVFKSYATSNQDGVLVLRPVHFSAIWRLVTGEKGNLFKEMQNFQR